MTPTTTENLAHQSTRGRVLLAEDDPELRALLADTLRDDGFQVVETVDGHGLLDQLAGALSGEIDDFDLIVSDILMPGFSAMDVLVAARSALRGTPVIPRSRVRRRSGDVSQQSRRDRIQTY